jgi:hypothetical protein
MIRHCCSRVRVRPLAAACFALASGGLVVAAQSPALPGPFETYGGNAWTVADFDGDGHPDILTARPELAGAVFRHRIEIQLSSGDGRIVSFAVDGVQPGLQVAARDVDGDHDIDLVFTTAVSHQPVGVWLNNGAGIFSPSLDAAPGSAFARIARAESVTGSEPSARLAYIPRPRSQSLINAPSASALFDPPATERLGVLPCARGTLTIHARPLTRAPPALL